MHKGSAEGQLTGLLDYTNLSIWTSPPLKDWALYNPVHTNQTSNLKSESRHKRVVNWFILKTVML
jgi:hypothetical protein